MENKILFAKLRDDAIIPSKRKEDAGYDIYAVIDKDIEIHEHSIAKIPTGIISAFSPDKVAILKERSSTGSKGMTQRCGVIDSGYRGEWKVPVMNGSDKWMVITKHPERYHDDMWVIIDANKAIAQAILLNLPDTYSEEVSVEQIMAIGSERGTGGFGSTGK